MAILKYELRQLHAHTLWWSVSIAAAVILILPAYINMLTSGAVDVGAVMNNDFFEMLGADISIISTPIGTYGYITSFFVIAAGINGMFLGLKTFTKETVGKTTEYTYTKPYRRGSIFSSKVLAAILSALLVGAVYYTASVLGAFMAAGEGIRLKPLTLLALSFAFIELFFIFLGALLGAVCSKLRSPLLVSCGIVFVFYVFSAYASKVNIAAIKYLTPFSYFGASKIVDSGGYNPGYMAALAVLCAIFAATGYITFVKKDISFIS